MKILLLGEYSGYYTHLARGLRQLGHRITFYNGSGPWVELKEGLRYPKYGNGIRGKMLSKLRGRADKLKFSGFDLVFIINPEYVNKPWEPWNWDHLRASNKKIIYTVCGQADSYVSRNAPYMRKSMFKDEKGVISMEHACEISRGDFGFCDRLVQEADGLITITGGYDIPYQKVEKPRACIPLPIDTNCILFEGIPEGPIQFLHGKQRRHWWKGTPEILRAFELINPKPNLHHIGGLPFEEYLRLMKSIHIVVDQCKSYGCGMNGLIAMAMGKIVMGGNEPENYTALGLPPSPVINLPFNVQLIKKAIIDLIERTDHNLLSEASRQYVEDHHEAKKVAQAYLEFASTL